MANLKRLSTKEDNIVSIPSPVTTEEISERIKDYDTLTPKQFGTKYKDLLFKPIEFHWNGKIYQIQYNHCANPYCKWHGLSQKKFPTKGKTSRYKLSGTGTEKILKCNPDPIHPINGATLDYNTITLSNWSIVQEIERLEQINSVQDMEQAYQFHKEGCVAEGLTPFMNQNPFISKGKVQGNHNDGSVKRVRNLLMFCLKVELPLPITNSVAKFFLCL
ncbi:MAG: hypothetical protein Q8934_02665 [Bacillota bacterium]|nr:hypothetical protein [Bacillota bacterium]